MTPGVLGITSYPQLQVLGSRSLVAPRGSEPDLHPGMPCPLILHPAVQHVVTIAVIRIAVKVLEGFKAARAEEWIGYCRLIYHPYFLSSLIQNFLYLMLSAVIVDYITPAPRSLISRLMSTRKDNKALWTIRGKTVFVKKVTVRLKCTSCYSDVKDGTTGFLCWNCGARSTLQPFWNVRIVEYI
jgi:hypothetical protein